MKSITGILAIVGLVVVIVYGVAEFFVSPELTTETAQENVAAESEGTNYIIIEEGLPPDAQAELEEREARLYAMETAKKEKYLEEARAEINVGDWSVTPIDISVVEELEKRIENLEKCTCPTSVIDLFRGRDELTLTPNKGENK